MRYTLDEIERINNAGDRYGHITPGVVAELCAEVRRLREDAERWAVLESWRVADAPGQIVNYHRKMTQSTTNEPVFGYTGATTPQIVYVDVPIMEVRVRWTDEGRKQPTLREAIDAAIKDKP